MKKETAMILEEEIPITCCVADRVQQNVSQQYTINIGFCYKHETIVSAFSVRR